MADFVVSGALDPRQLLEGLRQFEQAAATSGGKAGEQLFKGFDSKVSREIPSALQKSLRAAEAQAPSSGNAIGQGLASGINRQLGSTITSGLQKALTGAGSGASGIGSKIGKSLGDSVASGLGSTIPTAVGRALSGSGRTAQQQGQQVGRAFGSTAGQGIQSALPSAITRALGGGESQARSSGTRMGAGLGSAMGTSLGGTLPAHLKRVFTAGDGQASTSGRTMGLSVSKGLTSGLSADKALFATVVIQAQKAAQSVGIAFNSVKLRFETLKGEIIPEAQLQRIRQLSPAMDAAAGALTRLGGATTQGAQGLEQLHSRFSGVTRQGGLMEAAIGGVAFSIANTFTNAIGNAVNAVRGLMGEFMRLDSEIRLAATAAGEEGGYERLTKVIDQVGVEAAGTQMDVAQLATALVRAGYTVDEVAKTMPGVVRGAEATGTGFQQMGSIVGATLRGFGLDVKETSRVVDVLVKTANASNASVEGLGYTFQYAAPIANALKISLEDLAATAGLMANAGIDASVAGTGLRTGLQRLQKAAAGASGESLGLSKGQEKLTKAMQILGAEITRANGTLKPLDEVFIRLKQSMGEMEVAAQIELASAIFGDEAGSKFLAVTNQSEQAIGRMFQTIRESKGATETAREGMQSFGLAAMQLQGGLGVLGNTFGDVASKAMAPFLNAANLIVGALVAIPAPVRGVGAALTMLAGAYVIARVQGVAFKRAMEIPMVKDTITQIQVLARFLRMELRRDMLAATGQWKALQAAFSTGSSNTAVAGLANIAQGLRTLNAKQAISGFGQLFGAITGGSKGAASSLLNLAGNGINALKGGLGNAALSINLFGKGLRDMADKSRAAEAGLKGFALMLQRGMTTGASTAASSAQMLSTVLGKLGSVTGGSLATGFASAATAMAPLAIALAAIVPAVVGYNYVMGESRKVTATVGKTVDDFGKQLKESGVAFQNFRQQGGPMAELGRKLSDGFKDLVSQLKGIPGVGWLAAKAVEGLGEAIKNSPIGLLVRGVGLAIDKLRELYNEAKKNQGIIEAADQMRQFEEQFSKAEAGARNFVNRLKDMGTVAPAAVGPLTAELNRNVQVMSDSVAASKNVAAQFRDLAVAAKAAGNPELAKQYEVNARWADANAKIGEHQIKVLNEEAVKRGLVVDKVKEQAESSSLLAEKIRGLNEAMSSGSGQLEVAQNMLNLGKAMADLEQSRFNISKSRLQYDLQRAQELGASEGQLSKIRQEMNRVDAQALSARYTALVQQQELERQMLLLSQEKARTEANLAVLNAKGEILKAQAALQEAAVKGDKEAAVIAAQQVQLAEQKVGLEQSKVELLRQTQPIEVAIAKATQETAMNGLQAEAASKGWSLEAGNIYRQIAATKPEVAQTAQNMNAMSVSAKRAADGSIVIYQTSQQAKAAMQGLQGAANASANEMGRMSIEGKRAADGSIVLTQKTREASGAAGEAANNAGRMKTQLLASAGSANNLEKAVRDADGWLDNASGSSMQLSIGSSKAATALSTASTNARSLDQTTGQAAQEAQKLASSVNAGAKASGELGKGMDGAGKASKPADQTAASVARSIAAASVSAAAFAKTNFNGNLSAASGSAGGLANAMARAANSAQVFFNWLSKASGLPGSRWTGGPVEAGQQYRINELGQEAFLSGGKLSLINQPSNSLWRAPRTGVVIPAGVTEGLKAKGVFSGGGGRAVASQQLIRGSAAERRDQAAVLAQQAVAIGKLQQSVDRLVDKDWSVHVKVRNDAGGAAHLNALNRMR